MIIHSSLDYNLTRIIDSVLYTSKEDVQCIGTYLRRYPNMRKRTQKIMQAVPIWMPMTMLPREASPSLHWHRLFSPGNKHRTNEEHPHDRKKLSFGQTIIWHIYMVILCFTCCWYSLKAKVWWSLCGGLPAANSVWELSYSSQEILKRYSSCVMSLFGILPRYN